MFIHARSFVETIAVLQRTLIALCSYAFAPDVKATRERVGEDFAAALPGLKGVRDTVAHVEERVRGQEFGRKIQPGPIMNSMIHAPNGGAMVIDSLNGDRYGGRSPTARSPRSS
jgi:hypothetical protein